MAFNGALTKRKEHKWPLRFVLFVIFSAFGDIDLPYFSLFLAAATHNSGGISTFCPKSWASPESRGNHKIKMACICCEYGSLVDCEQSLIFLCKVTARET